MTPLKRLQRRLEREIAASDQRGPFVQYDPVDDWLKILTKPVYSFVDWKDDYLTLYRSCDSSQEIVGCLLCHVSSAAPLYVERIRDRPKGGDVLALLGQYRDRARRVSDPECLRTYSSLTSLVEAAFDETGEYLPRRSG